MGVLGVLGIIFIVLKVMGLGMVAAWSWWLVLLPFYLPLIICLVVILLGLVGVSVGALFSSSKCRF